MEGSEFFVSDTIIILVMMMMESLISSSLLIMTLMMITMVIMLEFPIRLEVEDLAELDGEEGWMRWRGGSCQ